MAKSATAPEHSPGTRSAAQTEMSPRPPKAHWLTISDCGIYDRWSNACSCLLNLDRQRGLRSGDWRNPNIMPYTSSEKNCYRRFTLCPKGLHLASKITTAANFRNLEGNCCTPAQ